MTAERTLILHIGTQKTASTLIRRFLKANVDRLAESDIRLVDRATLTESPFFGYLEKVTSGAVPVTDPVPEEIAANLAQMVDGPQSQVLMTSEILFHRLPLDDFYDRIADGLRLFQTLLPGWRIRVIFYVRVQKSFVESCYTQLLQMGKRVKFSVYTGGGVPTHLGWTRVCDDIAGVIGAENLTVRPFEAIRDLGTEGFLHDFLLRLGLSPDQAGAFDFDETLAEGKAANRGFSEVAVKMARFTMPMVDPKDRKKLRKFLQENFSTEHYPRPVYFSEEQATEMATFYRADNARLFATYIPDQDPDRLGY